MVDDSGMRTGRRVPIGAVIATIAVFALLWTVMLVDLQWLRSDQLGVATLQASVVELRGKVEALGAGLPVLPAAKRGPAAVPALPPDDRIFVERMAVAMSQTPVTDAGFDHYVKLGWNGRDQDDLARYMREELEEQTRVFQRWNLSVCFQMCQGADAGTHPCVPDCLACFDRQDKRFAGNDALRVQGLNDCVYSVVWHQLIGPVP